MKNSIAARNQVKIKLLSNKLLFILTGWKMNKGIAKRYK